MTIENQKMELISLISSDEFKFLISQLTEKSTFDYISVFTPTLITLIVAFFTYNSFSKRILQLKSEKIIEKDIDKLYEASQYISEYCDAVGLFFSMMDKKSIRIIEGREIKGNDFESKFSEANNVLFTHFSKIKYAIFILKTLRADEVAKKIKELEDIVITARKEQILIMEDYNKKPSLDKITAIKINYCDLRKIINKKKDDCINEIYLFKEGIKKQ